MKNVRKCLCRFVGVMVLLVDDVSEVRMQAEWRLSCGVMVMWWVFVRTSYQY